MQLFSLFLAGFFPVYRGEPSFCLSLFVNNICSVFIDKNKLKNEPKVVGCHELVLLQLVELFIFRVRANHEFKVSIILLKFC